MGTQAHLPSPPPVFLLVKNNLNPVWEPFEVSLNSLCHCAETGSPGGGTGGGGVPWRALRAEAPRRSAVGARASSCDCS